MFMVLRAVLPLIILMLGGAGFWLLNATAPVAVKRPFLERTPVVASLTVQPQSVTIPVYARGVITADTQLVLLAEYGGQIIEVSPELRPGGRLKRGQVVVRFDDSAIQHDITRVKARLETVRQRYATVRSEVDAERLVRGLASPQQFLQQKLDEAINQLKAAQAELSLAQLQLEKTVLKSPFDAQVEDNFVVVGQRVTPGFRVASLYDDAPRQVRLPLSDRQLRMINTDAISPDSDRSPQVMLRMRFGEGHYYWRGRLVSIQSSVDPRNRLTYVVAEIGEPLFLTDTQQSGVLHSQPPLRVGQLLEAEIQGHTFANVVALPREVLKEDDRVWLIDKNNRLRQKPVNVLYKGKGQLYIHDSLEPGDRVVSSPMDVAVDGMQVIPEKEPKATPRSGSNAIETPIARHQQVRRNSDRE